MVHFKTKLLEINLTHGYAKVADAILQNNCYHHYDRNHVAKLLKKAGLYQRALEHFTQLADIKRVIVNTHSIEPEFLVNYFCNLSVEESTEKLQTLMKANKTQNYQTTSTVASIAVKYRSIRYCQFN